MSSTVADDDLDAALHGRLEDVAEHLFGPPNRDTLHRTEWRWGSKGGRALVVRGPKRGAFHDHESGVAGGPLAMIGAGRNCSITEAARWARSYLGIEGAAPPDQAERDRRQQERDQRAREAAAAHAADEESRAAGARRRWERAAPIETGSAADIYIVATRAIPRPDTGWPASAVRYDPRDRAILLPLTTAAGQVRAIQAIYITDAGRKLGATEVAARNLPAVKVTYGPMAGAYARLPGPADRPLLVAEGPETALTVWRATGLETLATIGPMPRAELPTGRRVVICRDDDKDWLPADQALRKALDGWKAAGIDVVVATPWPERHSDKTDFNDAIKASGIEAVRARIESVIAPPAPPPARRIPVDDARRELDEVVGRFFADATTFDLDSGDAPIVRAVKVDTGVGKSAAARKHAARLLAAMRAAGDGRTVVIAVPRHDLGAEQAEAFAELPEAQEAGLTAACWRGMEAADPDEPAERMCRNLAAVRDARAAGADVQSATCRRKMKDGTVTECNHFHSCAYQQQRKRQADLWMVPHEMLYGRKPSAIGTVAAVVVDEAAWADGLEGVDGPPLTLALDALQSVNQVPGNATNTDRLVFLRRRAFDSLRDLSDGPVPREVLEVASLTASNANEARALEWMRKIDPGLHPLMTAAERKAVVESAGDNKTIRRLDLFWRGVEALVEDGGPVESGWIEVGTEPSEHGQVRVVRLKGRRAVRDGWRAPTLILDAMLDMRLIRPYWPQAEMAADIAVAAPHQRISQVVDASFSLNRLAPKPDADEKDQRRRARNLRDMHARLAEIGRRYAPGRVLEVTQKSIEEALQACGPLPPNVETAHHNAVAGRDGWRDVAALVTVGRTAPRPADVERLAEALTGAAVERLAGWYPRVAAVREMADGTAQQAEADRHPDPIAEAIRWQACEGELMQIIGRGRGVNRTQADPVDAVVLTDVPLPLPIDATFKAADLDPTPTELMLAAGGVALEVAAAAATAYPSIFSTASAARSALSRAQCAANPYRDSTVRECGTLAPPTNCQRWTYQRAGARQRPATALIYMALVPDPAAWLAERLGPLASCRPEAPEQPAGTMRPAAADPAQIANSLAVPAEVMLAVEQVPIDAAEAVPADCPAPPAVVAQPVPAEPPIVTDLPLSLLAHLALFVLGPVGPTRIGTMPIATVPPMPPQAWMTAPVDPLRRARPPLATGPPLAA